MFPVSASSSPTSKRSSVDLPTPFAPTIPIRSPVFMIKERSFKTLIAPYVFVRLRTVTNIYTSLPVKHDYTSFAFFNCYLLDNRYEARYGYLMDRNDVAVQRC